MESVDFYRFGPALDDRAEASPFGMIRGCLMSSASIQTLSFVQQPNLRSISRDYEERTYGPMVLTLIPLAAPS